MALWIAVISLEISSSFTYQPKNVVGSSPKKPFPSPAAKSAYCGDDFPLPGIQFLAPTLRRLDNSQQEHLLTPSGINVYLFLVHFITFSCSHQCLVKLPELNIISPKVKRGKQIPLLTFLFAYSKLYSILYKR